MRALLTRLERRIASSAARVRPIPPSANGAHPAFPPPRDKSSRLRITIGRTARTREAAATLSFAVTATEVEDVDHVRCVTNSDGNREYRFRLFGDDDESAVAASDLADGGWLAAPQFES